MKAIKEIGPLANNIGSFIEYWGFKNIQGRAWTYIFLSRNGLDAKVLQDILGISKGLTSMTINDLLEYNVILADRKEAHGKVIYKANPDVFAVIVDILRSRERLILSDVYSSLRFLKSISSTELDQNNIDKTRLNELARMVKLAETFLNFIISFKGLGKDIIYGITKKSLARIFPE